MIPYTENQKENLEKQKEKEKEARKTANMALSKVVIHPCLNKTGTITRIKEKQKENLEKEKEGKVMHTLLKKLRRTPTQTMVFPSSMKKMPG